MVGRFHETMSSHGYATASSSIMGSVVMSQGSVNICADSYGFIYNCELKLHSIDCQRDYSKNTIVVKIVVSSPRMTGVVYF